MAKGKFFWLALLVGTFLITLFLIVALLIFIPFDEVGEGSKIYARLLLIALIIGLTFLQFRILKKLKQ